MMLKPYDIIEVDKPKESIANCFEVVAGAARNSRKLDHRGGLEIELCIKNKD